MRCIAAMMAFGVLLAPVAHGQTAGTENPGASETLRIFEPNWGFPAYFMTARASIVRAMRAYLAAVCDGYNDAFGLDVYVHEVGDADWLCERKEIHFYRGVDGWGKKTRSGYACQKKLGVPDQDFFGDSRFAGYGCIFLYWNEESRGYEIEFMREEE